MCQVLGKCSRKISSHLSYRPCVEWEEGRRHRLYLQCKVPVTALDIPGYQCSQFPLSCSPEFMELCHCYLHPHLQYSLDYLKCRTVLLPQVTWMYMEFIGDVLLVGNWQLLLEAEIPLSRWQDALCWVAGGGRLVHLPNASWCPLQALSMVLSSRLICGLGSLG